MRQITAQYLTTLPEINHFGSILRRLVERDFIQPVIWYRHTSPIPQCPDCPVVQFLDLMGNVQRFTRIPHSITLDRLAKDNRRLSGMILRCLKRRIDFSGIMSATGQSPQLIVRQVFDHFQKAGILPEKMPADISAVSRLVTLVLTINGFHHDFL